jgi:hypothetical protein
LLPRIWFGKTFHFGVIKGQIIILKNVWCKRGNSKRKGDPANQYQVDATVLNIDTKVSGSTSVKSYTDLVNVICDNSTIVCARVGV